MKNCLRKITNFEAHSKLSDETNKYLKINLISCLIIIVFESTKFIKKYCQVLLSVLGSKKPWCMIKLQQNRLKLTFIAFFEKTEKIVTCTHYKNICQSIVWTNNGVVSFKTSTRISKNKSIIKYLTNFFHEDMELVIYL
jgi:hypothetical protein